MARGVRETIVVAADPERVWETVMDPALLERWVTAHDSYTGVAAGPLSAGDEFTQRLRLAGKGFKVRWKVIEADEPSLARWEGRGPGGSSANVTYKLTAQDGGTCFDYENEFALPGGPLGKVAGSLLVGARGRREARRSLERLRTLLERSSS
jgi:uncharacterized protein YndB with AHSA1/START domain